MRELMFRAEIKARRVKKIKSKTYRRLKRKEKERLGELIDVKGPDDDSETEEGRMKRETERAKERATLRHKHTGKWAKRMINREDIHEGTRKDLEDMLSRGERLRRRIQGVNSDQSHEDSSGDEDLRVQTLKKPLRESNRELSTN
jgi:U3 small nucleolar RNA-associated protein 14